MRLARQIIAGSILLFISLFFLNLTGFLPESISFNIFTKIQIIPAILSGFAIAIIGLTVLTLFTGRLYCSTICPLGIVQDLVIRLSKKQGRKQKRLMYRQPHTILRYGVLAITIISLILGSSVLAIWLDPYSIFGRLASSILSPIVTTANNVLASIFSSFGNYTFSHQEIHWGNASTIISSIAFLFILLYLNIKHQRLWCNTLCPVGTLLGFISKFSWVKIKVDQSKCISCNACSRSCKSNCIDEKNNYKIDYSRCVMCFNCIDSCTTKAINLTPTKAKHNEN